MVVNAQSEMRALLLHLRPVQLEGKKLTEGIEELLTELSRKQHMKIEWLIEPIELKRCRRSFIPYCARSAIKHVATREGKETEVRLRKIDQYAILKSLMTALGLK